MTLKEIFVSQNANATGSCSFVSLCDFNRMEVFADDPFRRARFLDFRDQTDFARGLKCREKVTNRPRVLGLADNVLQRYLRLRCFDFDQFMIDDLFKDRVHGRRKCEDGKTVILMHVVVAREWSWRKPTVQRECYAVPAVI